MAGPDQSQIMRILLGHAVQIAGECQADAILVYADVLPDGHWEKAGHIPQKVVFVTKTKADQEVQEALGHKVVRVPNVALTRLGQLKIAVFLTLNRGLLDPGDRVVCLSGIDESRTLDTLVVMEVGREFEMLVAPADHNRIAPSIRPEVLDRVIDIASDLGAEGREGKPVGALFVVGDTDRVVALSRQLVLNPFQGYPEDMRNILDPRLEETIKEFSTIDGAFTVQGDGTIVTAGAYLKTAGLSGETLPQGLGCSPPCRRGDYGCYGEHRRNRERVDRRGNHLPQRADRHRDREAEASGCTAAGGGRGGGILNGGGSERFHLPRRRTRGWKGGVFCDWGEDHCRGRSRRGVNAAPMASDLMAAPAIGLGIGRRE